MTPVTSEFALDFFLRLLLGHFVGDFFLQPYWLVLSKRAGWPGLIVHVGVVTFITALLVWGLMPYWWVWMMVLFLIHLFIDQFRTFIFTDNSKGKGLLLLLLDQLAHVISLMVIAWAATGWTPADLAALFSPDAPNHYRTMAYLTGLAVLISAAPVLEVEITVAVWAAQGQEMGKPLSIDREDRLLGSLERITAAAFILLGWAAAGPADVCSPAGAAAQTGRLAEQSQRTGHQSADQCGSSRAGQFDFAQGAAGILAVNKESHPSKGGFFGSPKTIIPLQMGVIA